MAVVDRYCDFERHGEKPSKQGGTAERPFVPELAKGIFISGSQWILHLCTTNQLDWK